MFLLPCALFQVHMGHFFNNRVLVFMSKTVLLSTSAIIYWTLLGFFCSLLRFLQPSGLRQFSQMNMLLTSPLHKSSLMSCPTVIFLHPPRYHLLCVFGCQCYILLPIHERDKFSTHSIPYVYLGLSAEHRGYRCYNPPFVEVIFPFMYTSIRIFLSLLLLRRTSVSSRDFLCQCLSQVLLRHLLLSYLRSFLSPMSLLLSLVLCLHLSPSIFWLLVLSPLATEYPPTSESLLSHFVRPPIYCVYATQRIRANVPMIYQPAFDQSHLKLLLRVLLRCIAR